MPQYVILYLWGGSVPINKYNGILYLWVGCVECWSNWYLIFCTYKHRNILMHCTNLVVRRLFCPFVRYRVFIMYCAFSSNVVIFMRGNRERPESGMSFNIFEKNTIFNEHPVALLAPNAPLRTYLKNFCTAREKKWPGGGELI